MFGLGFLACLNRDWKCVGVGKTAGNEFAGFSAMKMVNSRRRNDLQAAISLLRKKEEREV